MRWLQVSGWQHRPGHPRSRAETSAWRLAGEFALGQVPGSAAGSRFAHHVQGPVIRRAFGWFMVALGLFFIIYRIAAH